jgi:hypothetical protein
VLDRPEDWLDAFGLVVSTTIFFEHDLSGPDTHRLRRVFGAQFTPGKLKICLRYWSKKMKSGIKKSGWSYR